MTGAAEAGRRALLRTELRIAILVNAALSIGFFLLVFGWRDAAARDLAIDFLPQTFGVTFLGTLIPSLITLRKIALGRIVPAGPVPTRGRHVLRIIAWAVGAVIILGGSAAALFTAFAPPMVPPLVGVTTKAVYGGLVGALITPPILRAALGMPFRQGRAPRTAARAR